MNFRVIGLVLGILLIIESVFMLFGLPFSYYYQDADIIPIFFSSGITFVAGLLMFFLNKKASRSVGKRESYVIVGFGWIVLSIFGTLPFILSGAIPSFTDAFFETMSGFSTTGASILNDIEALPHGVLFWRSLTQWIGGMGIIVLSIAILPLIKVGGMQMFAAEVPGPTTDKLHPKIKYTAQKLWFIYLGFTAVETLLLKLGGMNLFDAINHSLTTMATGGYSTKQASVAYYSSPFIQYVIIFFMFMAGVNFSLSYFAITGKPKKMFKNSEFRHYTGIVLIATVLIALGLIFRNNLGVEKAFRDALFQVVSIVTTTGFATTDYLQWQPSSLWILLFMLMFIGGSAGSTGGGIKVVRIQLLFKNALLELRRLIHPNAVIPVRYNNQAVPPQIITNILAFVMFYLIIYFTSVFIMSLMGLDLDTALGAVAASIGNIGPGIGKVGPADNFAFIHPAGKYFLSFLMLIGRLELFTVIILFSPQFWRK